MDVKSFGEMELGILNEVGNVGFGRIAMSLANIVGSRLDISVTRSYLLTRPILEYLTEGLSEDVFSFHLNMEGDFTGGVLILLPPDMGKEEVASIKSQEKDTFINMHGSYVSSIQQYFQKDVSFSLEENIFFEGNKKDAIRNRLKPAIGEGEGLIIATRVFRDGSERSGHFYLYFDNKSVEPLKEALSSVISALS